MIVIKSIETIEVKGGDYYQVAKFPTLPMPSVIENMQNYTVDTVEYETVLPTRFINSRGERLEICMTQEVQEILGIPMEAFNEIRNRNDALSMQLLKLQDENRELKKHIDILVKEASSTIIQCMRRLFK